MLRSLNPDSFNPRIHYVSKEYYDSGNSLSSHFHPFCVIMYTYGITGSGWYRIEGRLYPIVKGMLVVCNPAVYHEKLLEAGSGTCEYHIAFDNMRLPGQSQDCILADGSHAVLKDTGIENRLEHGFCEILEEQESACPGSELVVKTIAVKQILLVLRLLHSNPDTLRTYSPTQSEPSCANIKRYFSNAEGKHYIVESVRDYLNKNYQNGIRIGDIAQALNISHVYLSRVFRQELGETPVSYLTKLRLNMGRELLESGCCSIKSAAAQVGYEDSGYFSRHFKKHFGFRPIKCRQLEQKQSSAVKILTIV